MCVKTVQKTFQFHPCFHSLKINILKRNSVLQGDQSTALELQIDWKEFRFMSRNLQLGCSTPPFHWIKGNPVLARNKFSKSCDSTHH